jgi:hypothetical protein
MTILKKMKIIILYHNNNNNYLISLSIKLFEMAQELNYDDIKKVEQRMAGCGWTPVSVSNWEDINLFGEEFLGGVNHNLRIPCVCSIGSLWKRGYLPLIHDNQSTCSNHQCEFYISYKIRTETE